MSDEHEQRRDPARGGAEPDDTRQFSPFDNEPQPTAPNHPNGDPQPGEPAGDETRWVPPADDATVVTPVPPADDATVVTPVPPADDATVATPVSPPRDATAVMPAADGGAADPVWAGRAEVRPPGPAPLDDTAADWSTVSPAEPTGKWWMPILVGFVALVLLGAIIWGFYLIAQNMGDDDPASPAPASAPAVPLVPTTTEPTTTPPTTTPTTTEPTGPTEVTVPALIGLSRAEAQQALERRGLSFREIVRPSDAAPGTVIDSDPTEGQEVPPDTLVTLVIAAERTTTATPPTTTPTTTPPGGSDESDESGEN
ncbi:PASTA domain-containing protein [Jidongwangia harbinensis]|uniref:PASTA domain-containing protein n=1 Tax=Jidongwangia harbinensis TaxID=2878561 RepID=UPI001CDA0CF2|nr:PASTA domain-containing protein [Jidongwangia harbinensis]MCA2212780.1 PASTA domain-containing protein [Jidongwangia harbinensis]